VCKISGSTKLNNKFPDQAHCLAASITSRTCIFHWFQTLLSLRTIVYYYMESQESAVPLKLWGSKKFAAFCGPLWLLHYGLLWVLQKRTEALAPSRLSCRLPSQLGCQTAEVWLGVWLQQELCHLLHFEQTRDETRLVM
jgi:hypothetical protein